MGTSNQAVTVIQQMVTPALLLLATASLLGLVLGRAVRIVEHVHNISASPSETDRAMIVPLERRLRCTERAMAFYFYALALAGLTCLSIVVDHFASGALFWLPVGCAFLTVTLQTLGTAFLLSESRIAATQVREELGRIKT